MEPRWAVLRSQVHREAIAARAVHAKGVESYLPWLPAARGARAVHPLFPGYLFALVDALDSDPPSWDALRWAPGVRRILGTEDVPVPVPNEVIETIQVRMNDFGFVRPGPRFMSGSRVRFRHGPLVGLEAIFEGPMSREGRVRVLLELLGQSRVSEVDEIDLELA